ncbi:MAG: Nif11-like leader peptide family natural product precursor [Nostochopsis sp.]
MSKEAVLSLIQEAQTNQELLQQLEAATGTTRVLEIGSAKNYEFNEEELLAVMQEQQLNFAGQEPELSEEELESVAGGDINIRIKIKW